MEKLEKKVKICQRKEIVEQMLFPTGLSCEECEGYDNKCELYLPIDERKDTIKKYGYDWS